MFEVRQTLKPGDAGTRRLAARFGDRLVCIRYREDALREKAKEEGAIWRPRQKLWEMPLQMARRLGLVTQQLLAADALKRAPEPER